MLPTTDNPLTAPEYPRAPNEYRKRILGVPPPSSSADVADEASSTLLLLRRPLS